MTIAILGASGFVGQNLVDYLLKTTDHKILAISRHPQNLMTTTKNNKRLSAVHGDILDEPAMAKSLTGTTVAFYLVHTLGKNSRNFVEKEDKAAKAFCRVAKKCDIKRIIYLGGLGDEKQKLSKHLASRQSIGRILRQNLPLVLEFRASIIVGQGSTSFEVIKTLVNRLPIMILPNLAYTPIQPIAISDVTQYLAKAITVSVNRHEIIEIGGPEVMSYKEIMLRYAQFKGKSLHIICISFLPKWPGVLWLYLFLPKSLYNVTKSMVSSLPNSTVVTNNRSIEFFGNIKPIAIEASFN